MLKQKKKSIQNALENEHFQRFAVRLKWFFALCQWLLSIQSRWHKLNETKWEERMAKRKHDRQSKSNNFVNCIKWTLVNYGRIRSGYRNSSIWTICITISKYNYGTRITRMYRLRFWFWSYWFGWLWMTDWETEGKKPSSFNDQQQQKKKRPKPSNKTHILDGCCGLFSLCTWWLTKTNVKIGILTIRNFSAFTNTHQIECLLCHTP